MERKGRLVLQSHISERALADDFRLSLVTLVGGSLTPARGRLSNVTGLGSDGRQAELLGFLGRFGGHWALQHL